MRKNHFIAKITTRGGPDPQWELDKILLQAADSDDHTAWFATRKPGSELQIRGDSRSLCIIIIAGSGNGRTLEGIVAEIVERKDTQPDDPVVQDIYAGWEGFKGWWKLRNPTRRNLCLAEISGKSTTGKTANETFTGTTVSFAYWTWDNDHISKLASKSVQPTNLPSKERGKAEPTSSKPEQSSKCFDRSALSGIPISSKTGTCDPSGRSGNLFGVDFSGGQEGAQGNPKIWVASWFVSEQRIVLEQGTDVGLKRSGLPEKIKSNYGWWVLDFPFGIALKTANAIGLGSNQWESWLNWCHAGPNALQLRDGAKTKMKTAGIPWAQRRNIDAIHRTTWFPLFEQLFRQTITGAAEVLWPLVQPEARSSVAILPWHDHEKETSVVCEGFPGVTIRSRLRLEAVGYKKATEEGLGRRTTIVSHLRQQGLPIDDAVAQRAINDTEGDAVDALVLLVAALVSRSLGPERWRQEQQRLLQEQRLIEGWFPS